MIPKENIEGRDRLHFGALYESCPIMDIDIEAVSWPGHDRPAMQNIKVVGKAEDGQLSCTLARLRSADPCFEITRADTLVATFDEHGAFAYGLAEDVRKRRRVMTARHGEEPFVSGFIGIIGTRSEPAAVGNRFGLDLVRYLKRMRADIPWYAGLQAAPYDAEHGNTAYRDTRRRLSA